MQKLTSSEYPVTARKTKTGKSKAVTISVIAVTSLVLFSRVLGLAREVLLAKNFGISLEADAYLMALMIPSILYVAIGNAIQEVMIPVISKAKKNKAHSYFLANNVLNIMMLLTGMMTLAGLLFTEEIVHLFAPGYEGEVFELTVLSARIIFPSIMFVCIAQMMTAILQANNVFVSSNLPFAAYNLVVTLYLLLFDADIYMLSIATLAASFAQMAVQMPALYKLGYKFRFVFQVKNAEIKKIFIMLVPLVLGASTQQVNMLIDRMIASTLGEGVIAALNYSFRLNGVAYTVLIVGLITVLYPKLSELAGSTANKDKELFKKTFNIILFLTLPSMVILVLLSEPIIQQFFERGSFDGQATEYTSIALRFYAVGIVALGLKELLNKTFYTLNDTKTPMINSLIGIALNILFNLTLIRFMGYAGLALGTSLAAIVTMLMLAKALQKKGDYFKGKEIILTGTRFSISAIVMGITLYSLHTFCLFFMSPLLALAFSITCSFGLYAALLLMMKQEETVLLMNTAKRFLKGNR